MKFSEEQVKQQLKELIEWHITPGGEIQKTYLLKNFLESINFINRLAKYAEEVQHHPDLFISWNKVKVTLITHDCDGLSEKDFEFAKKADQIFGEKNE
ncbi:MAG: 4a-hydroxytetrahydrobiopterin dehydratase [Bdellovibrionaceae bacterium]|nr:4a-hydroxytetrahydrobiopterin dehydratase [Pseudobdellovibrionaceae bacterium]|tara:strand:- start:337 stop:630 length:294 start_codon:yes stop_codon:yes gene_type:complete